MRRLAKVLIVLLVLAALPLRGYAGAVAALCDAHHGGAPATHAHSHADDASHDHGSDDGGGNATRAASVCSLCASCCVNASLAPDAPQLPAFQATGADRIPFFDRQVPGFVPEQPDRPPLPLSR